jgi:hypothetical protein
VEVRRRNKSFDVTSEQGKGKRTLSGLERQPAVLRRVFGATLLEEVRGDQACGGK